MAATSKPSLSCSSQPKAGTNTSAWGVRGELEFVANCNEVDSVTLSLDRDASTATFPGLAVAGVDAIKRAPHSSPRTTCGAPTMVLVSTKG